MIRSILKLALALLIVAPLFAMPVVTTTDTGIRCGFATYSGFGTTTVTIHVDAEPTPSFVPTGSCSADFIDQLVVPGDLGYIEVHAVGFVNSFLPAPAAKGTFTVFGEDGVNGVSGTCHEFGCNPNTSTLPFTNHIFIHMFAAGYLVGANPPTTSQPTVSGSEFTIIIQAFEYADLFGNGVFGYRSVQIADAPEPGSILLVFGGLLAFYRLATKPVVR